MNTQWAKKLMMCSTLAIAQSGNGQYGNGQYGNGQYGNGQSGNGQYQGPYDDQHWGRGPQGYSDNYHEQQGRPMYGARQGWAAGMAQGESDRQHGHSFRPTKVDTYKNVPSSPSGYSRDQFKQEYRDAFVKGYQRGYGQ